MLKPANDLLTHVQDRRQHALPSRSVGLLQRQINARRLQVCRVVLWSGLSAVTPSFESSQLSQTL